MSLIRGGRFGGRFMLVWRLSDSGGSGRECEELGGEVVI